MISMMMIMTAENKIKTAIRSKIITNKKDLKLVKCPGHKTTNIILTALIVFIMHQENNS